MRLGVIVARFQTPRLTQAHFALLQQVRRDNDSMLVLLGCTGGAATDVNPFSFEVRRFLVQRAIGDSHKALTILPLYDMPDRDPEWSASVDSLVQTIIGREPGFEVRLYGGRDCFESHYTGRWPVTIIPHTSDERATDVRNQTKTIQGEQEFLSGICHVHQTRYPIVYPVVDVAIYNPWRREVLLCRKKTDAPGVWGFLGGHVDPTDESLEAAAHREAFEESGGLELAAACYINSAKIRDPRYHQGKDGMIGSLFVLQYIFGHPKASDDIDEVQWFECLKFNWEDLSNILSHHHDHMLAFLRWENENGMAL